MLSDLDCRKSLPKAKPYKLYDQEGLYLLITPSGGKLWRFKCYFLGKEKKLSLGAYPAISLAEARERQEKYKSAIAKDIDPTHLKKEEKKLALAEAAETFEKVSYEWHRYYYDTWSERHAEAILYRLKKDVLPDLGKLPVSQITPSDVANCIKAIEARKRHETARRALQTCGQVMRYAVGIGKAKEDVTRDLRGTLKRYKKKHFASIEIDELPELVKALERNSARLFEQTINATKLMLLTFVRTGELIEAEWSEFDLKKAAWHIPATRMKMREAHFVPLSKQAIAILKRQKEISGKRKYVFPSIPRPDQPMSKWTVLAALKRLGYKNKMTGHGFRALAMSTLKEKLKYRHEIVDRQLAHLPRSQVDQAYDRARFIPDRIKMMQRWADYIDTLK